MDVGLGAEKKNQSISVKRIYPFKAAHILHGCTHNLVLPCTSISGKGMVSSQIMLLGCTMYNRNDRMRCIFPDFTREIKDIKFVEFSEWD